MHARLDAQLAGEGAQVRFRVAAAREGQMNVREHRRRQRSQREVLAFGDIEQSDHEGERRVLGHAELAPLERSRALERSHVDPVADHAHLARGNEVGGRERGRLVGADGDEAVRLAREFLLDRAEERAREAREHCPKQEREGVGRVDSGSDARRPGREPSDGPSLARVRVHDVRTQFLQRRSQREDVRHIPVRPDRAHHRQLAHRDALAVEQREVIAEAGLAQGRGHQRDAHSTRAQPAAGIDDVSACSADRRLDHVQDVHRSTAQYAPVPFTTAKPVSAMMTTSSSSDWCSM